MEVNTSNAGRQIVSFGILMTINFPLFMLIWYYEPPQNYQNATLRLVATGLSLALALKNYWPMKTHWLLPIYWYFVITFTLPFFFIFMTLKNDASVLWLMNLISALFFILLIVDIVSALIILAIGAATAWFVFELTTPMGFQFNPGSVTIGGLVATFTAALVIGGFFSRNREYMENEKLHSMKLLGSSISHELRTPLTSLNMGIKNLRKYLPDLFSSYQIAKEANLSVPEIRPRALQLLAEMLDSMESETNAASIFIDIMLMNVATNSAAVTTLEQDKNGSFSIAKCVENAMNRYPFQEGEKELIHWKNGNDFIVTGRASLLIHILFNLFKNALYYIAKAGKGDITIWLERGEISNKLYFKDTGAGIATDVLPHIFEQFFSRTYHGAGIGLSFSRMAMESMHGTITCTSEEGKYTQFVLTFPCTENKARNAS